MNETRAKYNGHKSNANKRGIAFDLTFEEWTSIWGQRIKERGCGTGQLGMLRTRDEGGYTVGNVRLGTPKENSQEAALCRKVARASRGHVEHNKYNPGVNPAAAGSWLSGRSRVFDEYVEEEEY